MIREQFWHPNNDSFVSNKEPIIFKHLCEYCIVLDTERSECECLECHMTSNDVREECYIVVMMGRFVYNPV